MDQNTSPDPVQVERIRSTLDAAFTASMDRHLLNLPMQTEMAKVAFLHGVFAGLSVMISAEVPTPDEGYRKLLALNEAVLSQLEELDQALVQFGAG